VNILILTQYFPPEIGAPQNRLFELAVRLQKKGASITVLTAMPNYPQMQIHEAYKGKIYKYETMSGMHVHRAWIYVSKSKSILSRLLNYFSFVLTSLWHGLFKVKGQYDFILCESPPLFLGITAYLLKILKGSKLIFNVSDLWPESAEKLGLVTNKTLLSISTKLEEFLYRKSTLITGQTQGIVNNIKSRLSQKKVYWLPNGVDLNYYNPDTEVTTWRKENGFSDTDFIILYAGIIGHAQGLEIIVNAANRLKENAAIKFVLMGSGPEKEKLMQLAADFQLTSNVLFFDAVTKSIMPEVVGAANASVIPLKKLDLFKGAIPSKIFESLAMKKAILLGVDGEARELFVNEGNCAVYFEPENIDDLVEKVVYLYQNPGKCFELGENAREYVNTKFNREQIASSFFIELENLL
jgi:glycosyltransferase involved in cell wall biosynthesis